MFSYIEQIQAAMGERLAMVLFALSSFSFSMMFAAKSGMITLGQIVIFPIILFFIAIIIHMFQVIKEHSIF